MEKVKCAKCGKEVELKNVGGMRTAYYINETKNYLCSECLYDEVKLLSTTMLAYLVLDSMKHYDSLSMNKIKSLIKECQINK